MSAPFTAGPWQIKGDYLDGCTTIIANVDGEIIDGTTYNTFDFIATCVDEYGEASLDAVGNARLIAAAPDYDAAAALALPILEADRQIFFDCHTVGKDINTLSESERTILAAYDAAIGALRTAIAKARGAQ